MTHHQSDRLSICFFNSNEVWGGGEKWHFETACELHSLGYQVLAITNRKSDLYLKFIEHEGIIVKAFSISNFSFLNPFKIIALKRCFLRFNIDTVILGLSIDLKLGGIAAKLAGVRQIIYRRGSAVSVRNSLLNRLLFRSVLTQVITNSEEIRENIFHNNPTLIARDKVHIIYNGINLKRWPNLSFFTRSENNREVLMLGNAGRLVEQKGQEYLIKVARHLKDQDLAFKLYIAGTGELKKKLKQLSIDYKLKEEIIFLDFVEDMSEFLKSLDIYLSTSLHEGSSHVILEAMASGKPIVAFDVSSMPELISDGETGYLVPLGDTEAFARKIIYLKNHADEIGRFGVNARAKVESNFTFAGNLQQVIQLIEE